MQADQIPAELVEAAARMIDPEAFEAPPRGYSPGAAAQSAEDARGKAAEILAAVYREVQARALQEARHAIRAMTPAPNSRLTWESAQSKAARTLLEMEKALRTPDPGVGGGERG